MSSRGKRGKIIISGLRFFAHHGCTQREREEGQEFLVDVELEYDAGKAVEGDDLAAAVDYDRLACEVYDIATRERYDLLETLTARIGKHLVRTTPALSVLVRVHKPHAPLRQEVEEVAVEMHFGGDGR